MAALRALRPRGDLAWGVALAVAALLAVIPTQAPLPVLALPAGVLLAGLARYPWRNWPVLLVMALGALLGVQVGAGLPLADGLAVAGLQAAAAAMVAALLHLVGIRRITTITDLCVLGCLVVGGGAIAATGIALMVPAQAGLWAYWWLAVTVGMALPAPGLLCGTPWHLPSHRRRYVEAGVLLAATGVVMVAGYPAASADPAVFARWGYLLLPLVLWFGLRFGLRAISTLATVLTAGLMGGLYRTQFVGMAGPDTSWISDTVAVLATVTALLLIYGVALLEEKRRLGEQRLQASQDFVRSFLSNSPAVVAVTEYDAQGTSSIVTASPMLQELVSPGGGSVVGRSWIEVLGPVAGVQAQREDLQVLGSEGSHVFVTRLGPRGHRRILMTTKFPVRLADARVRAVGMVALDVTEHRRRDRIMRLTFDLSPVPMARLSVSGHEVGPVLDANAAIGDLLGITPAELRGRDLRDFLHPEERDIAWSPDVGTEEGRGTPREVRMVSSGGRLLWASLTLSAVHEPGDGDEQAFALAVIEDVTGRHEVQQTLTYQAHHDALTGLPNRYALVERLEAALQRLWATPSHLAVLFCDLDGFKTLNDTLSHRAGDEVLTSVAERLRGAVRPQDTVARLGGDEFVVIADQLASSDEAVEIGQRLCDSLGSPFRVAGREVGLSLSVGVALTADPRTSSQDLLRQADLAMYRAKDNGRNRVEAYHDTLEAAAVTRMEVQEQLRIAIAESYVRVEYQPIVALDGSGVTALEALVRIPSEIPIETSAFIEAAEKNGLMGVLGDEVLRLVVHDLAGWRAQGIHTRVHINVSPAQLVDEGFPDRAFERLMGASVPPNEVCFEVNDSAWLRAGGEVLASLRRLHEVGFRIGIDGFGAGHAGMTSLKEIAADYLKIARSFVEHLDTTEEDRVIVEAVVRVAHGLGRKVIATGVERQAQVFVLQRLGCDEVQGYLHSASVRASRVPGVMASMR